MSTVSELQKLSYRELMAELDNKTGPSFFGREEFIGTLLVDLVNSKVPLVLAFAPDGTFVAYIGVERVEEANLTRLITVCWLFAEGEGLLREED